MATPEPSLVVAPADIAAHWDLDLSGPFEPLATVRNLVFRCGAYVIREAQASVDNVRWEHELLEFLAPRMAEVHAPLHASDGSTLLAADGRVVWVIPYVDAEPANRSDAKIRDALPRLLARLHTAVRDWPDARPRPDRPPLREQNWVANDLWDWDVIERPTVVERAYSEAREWLASPPPLAESAVHGDFHPENLLASKRGIEAVIDWEFARCDWTALDVAAAVTVLSLQRDGTIDGRIADETVSAYVAGGGTHEPEALPSLMQLFLLAVALHNRTRQATGATWDPDFQAMIERALAGLG